MEIKDDFMKKVLIGMFAFLLVFTITMIVVFCNIGEVPDSLIIAVFGACAGEYSICGLIKNAKEREKTQRMRDGFVENYEEYNDDDLTEEGEEFINAILEPVDSYMSTVHNGDIEEEAID